MATAHSLFQSSQDVAGRREDGNDASEFDFDQLAMVEEQIVAQQGFGVDSLDGIWKVGELQVQFYLQILIHPSSKLVQVAGLGALGELSGAHIVILHVLLNKNLFDVLWQQRIISK